MREILFRGKGVLDSKWKYGDLIKSEEKFYIHPQRNLVEVNKFIGNKIVMYEVLPEIVGQYTGLLDKNGNKIFEGDIIKDIKDNGELLVVEGDTLLGFDFRYIDGEDNAYTTAYDIGLSDDYTYLMSAVVVGNIHDNPELLEAGK